MASVVRPSLRVARAFLAGTRLLSTSTPRYNTIPFQIIGKGKGVAQSVQVKDSHHRIEADAYPAFGGKDASPSPLHYCLTALSTCTQVTGSIVAKDAGIELVQWNVEVDGQLDPSVLVKGVEGNANWKSIDLRVEVITDASDEAFEKFASETERRCPVTQLYKRSGVEWSSSWSKKKVH